ncbi:MAG: ABC transporter ATP-binding protein [bacterium]
MDETNHGAVNEASDFGVRRMFRLGLRCWPYIRPLLKHLLTLGGLAVVLGIVYAAAAFIGTDIFSNKVLLGQKLQPVQATLLLLGEEYVGAEEFTPGESAPGEPMQGSFPTQVLTDDEAEPVPELTTEQRRTVRDRLLVWAIALGILAGLGICIAIYYNLWIWQSVNQNLRVAMVERAEQMSLRDHSGSRVGDAMFRVFQDSAMIVNLLQHAIASPLVALFGIIVGLVFISAFDPFAGLIVVFVGIPMIWLTVLFTSRIRRAARSNRIAFSDLTSRLQEVFAVIKVVKANRGEPEILARFNEDSKQSLDAAYRVRFEILLLSVLVMLLGGIMFIGLEFLMASWVLDGRETLLGAWAVAFIGFAVWNYGAWQVATGRVQETIFVGFDLVRTWSLLQDLFIALDRAFFLLDQEPDVIDPESPVDYPLPIKRVEWRHVRFGYDPAKLVLKDVTLTAGESTVTAIVGGSGAGKSTLMSMLLRLYDPDAGQVLINDVNLRSLRIDDVRGNTAIALQKNVLFSDTIANNISYATTNATREDVQAAAKVACADEFIEAMPNGYETELGERGSKLSSGQRQRLSIARAIVRDTPILILDEPTAALDAQTEQQVLANLVRWGRGRIIFIVTHRLSTIRNADQIAFLKDGCIVECGSHEQLMAMQAGAYRQFVDLELQVAKP